MYKTFNRSVNANATKTMTKKKKKENRIKKIMITNNNGKDQRNLKQQQ